MRCFIFSILVAMSASVKAQVYIPKFDLQGHRGARGLKPENTIPAFIEALNLGVTTIELDVVITKDKQVLVSHEPWMSAEICLTPNGEEIDKRVEKIKYNIFELNYDSIKQFDCGSIVNPKFPQQEKLKISKPLLRDVIFAVENHIKNFTQYEVDYNIEIKSAPEGDGKFHPSPEEFSDLVYSVIYQYLPLERVVIQSFDFRVLQYWNKTYPHVRLAVLVENSKSPSKNLADLGFNPTTYSPYFKLLSKDHVDYLHKLTVTGSAGKMRVIPWTINEPDEMQKMKVMGVDGIITDYPDRAASLNLTLNKSNKANGKSANKR